MRARILALPATFTAPTSLLRPRLPRARTSLALAATTLALATIATRSAQAECNPQNQVSSCVGSDNLWPHAGASCFMAIGSAQTIAPRQLSFAFVASYQKKPLVLRYPGLSGPPSEVAAIDEQANATFLTAYAPGDVEVRA